MTHFIADVALTQFDNDQMWHAQCGGPDWDQINVGTLIVTDTDGNHKQLIKNGEVQGLRPIPPVVATMEMAYQTYLGRDEINGFDPAPDSQNLANVYPGKIENYKGKYAAEILPTTRVKPFIYKSKQVTEENAPYSETRWGPTTRYPYPDKCRWPDYNSAVQGAKERIKVLLKWAAYYAACAILYVMEEADFQDDVSLSRLDPSQPPDIGLGEEDKPDRDEVLEAWEVKYGLNSNSKYAKKNLHLWDVASDMWISLGVLIPIFALAILPVVTEEARRRAWSRGDGIKYPGPQDYEDKGVDPNSGFDYNDPNNVENWYTPEPEPIPNQ